MELPLLQEDEFLQGRPSSAHQLCEVCSIAEFVPVEPNAVSLSWDGNIGEQSRNPLAREIVDHKS